MTDSRDQWLALVDKVLKGAPFERLVTTTSDGIEIQPLYTAADIAGDAVAEPGEVPFVRGVVAGGRPAGAWDVRTVIDHPDVRTANRWALDALQNGATSLSIRFDRAFRSGGGSDGAGVGVDGVAIWTCDDLDAVLDGVFLDLAAVEIDAGARAHVAAGWLAELGERRALPNGALSGTIGADPLATMSSLGCLPQGLEQAYAEMVGLVAEPAAALASMRAIRIDTSPHAHAGATPAMELAALLATGARYLRAADGLGVAPDVVCGRLDARLTVDADVFMSIAKLRAARRVWSAMTAACGVAPSHQGLPIVAAANAAMMTRRDPWVNLLRVTSSTFGAVAGGAESVITLPYDAELGGLGERGRRLARNTQLVLGEEAHIGRVGDPAGGSWYVEDLTERLSEHAWEVFQEIEAAGGMAASLVDGSWRRRLDEQWARRSTRLATRKEPITGVSEFPDLDEPDLSEAPIDLTAIRSRVSGAGVAAITGTETRVDPLPIRHLADDFEALRERADAAVATGGSRPSVFLANLGPVAVHTARAGFARNFYAAGGIGTLDNDGFGDDESLVEAFTASGATVACLCSSDAVYAERAVGAVSGLRASGAQRVEMAGRPGELRDALDAAGVDAYIAVGTDVVADLRELHDAMGVAR